MESMPIYLTGVSTIDAIFTSCPTKEREFFLLKKRFRVIREIFKRKETLLNNLSRSSVRIIVQTTGKDEYRMVEPRGTESRTLHR